MRLLLTLCLLMFSTVACAQTPERPNIIWITIDDIDPSFATNGNPYSHTPNVDAFARRGQQFNHQYVSTPVCSPVRSALITGCYANTIGSHQHRSNNPFPQGAPFRPVFEILRDQGYRLTRLPWDRVNLQQFLRNDPAPGRFVLMHAGMKTDYNFSRNYNVLQNFEGWDANAEGPFFSFLDFSVQKRPQPIAREYANRTGCRVNPSDLELRPYWPDTPEFRNRLALYHEAVSLLDAEIGRVLDWVEQSGLSDNTVIFIWGDHGMAFIRHKQWCYDTGLRTPLFVAGPGIEPGQRNELVSSIDLAPTTLHLAGVEQPQWMQGQTFLGPDYEPRTHIFATRDRCDETEDRIRAIRDERFKLIWNLRPELSYLSRNAYTLRAFLEEQQLLNLGESGRATPTQALMLRDTKPEWEFFDTQADPLELNNLIDDPAYTQDIARLRALLESWVAETDANIVIPEQMNTITPNRVRPQVRQARQARGEE